MPYVETRLIPGSVLTNAVASYYTTPTSTIAILKQLTLCNTDVASRTVTLYIVPNVGDAPATKDTVLSAVTMQPNETKIFGLTDVLPTGYTIKALASISGVVAINASGVERT